MTGMLDLRNILELIDNRLDDCSFAQQQLVRKIHELTFHIFVQSRDQVHPLFKKQLREWDGNVATISEQLATQFFHELRNRCSIIDIARSQTTAQQFAALIDGQCSLNP